MNLEIRAGTPDDITLLATLYDDLIDHLAATTNYPGWKKGAYPTRETAEEGVRTGSLFVAIEQGEIAGTIILQHQPPQAYSAAPWQAALDPDQALVIRTFAVSPGKAKRGIGRKLLAFAEQYAKDAGVLALRLDVYETNLPAIRLYESCGYRYIDTVSLGLEEYGLDWFKLYEKLL